MNRRNRSPLETERANAAFEAARRHVHLSTDLSKRVDIFDIIRQEGLWLMFQPLGNLYGSYLRIEDGAGILINANHPLNLQRFTASHEYGHFVLKHTSSFDEEESIQPHRGERNLQEAAAQTFAAHFLMPLQLVNTVLRGMGLPIKPENLTPMEAYNFSLEVGTSYSAAVNHLVTLNKISWQVADELKRREPKNIKAEIGHGTRPQDVWADTWDLDERDSGKLFHIRVNDELHIRLPEAPSTGYIWTIENSAITDLRIGLLEQQKRVLEQQLEREPYLALVDERFESSSRSGDLRLGAGGLHRFLFRSLRPGQQTLRLINRRPWQRNVGQLKSFEVSLDITPKDIQGLSELQHESLLVGV